MSWHYADCLIHDGLPCNCRPTLWRYVLVSLVLLALVAALLWLAGSGVGVYEAERLVR